MRRRRVVLFALLLVIVVITAALIVTTVVCACQPSPLAPTNGPVAGDNPLVETREMMFMSNRDGDWDIYVMSLKDRSVKNLTHNDADDGFGTYSADGGAITFLSNRNGTLDPFMMNADGSGVRPLANDLPTIFSVVSSGRLDWDFTYRAADQSAFVSLRDLNLEIYAKDAGGERNLTHNNAVDWFPAWSQDGNQIAFSSDRDGNQEIYVMDANGGHPRRLTDAPGDDLYPLWWGNTVVFMSDRDIPFAKGQIGLYALDLDAASPQPQRVTPALTIAPLGAQIWPGNGEHLYASNADGDWDIVLADSVGRNQTILTDNSADDVFPQWRPQKH